MENISSRRNVLITETAKLAQKKYRDETGLFYFEGRKLFLEAAAAGVDIKHIITTPRYYEKYRDELPGYKVYTADGGVFSKLTDEKAPEGIICVAGHIDFLHNYIKIYNIPFTASPPLCRFMVSSIQDPGNLGTIIRAANAFGIGTLILDGCCADIYGPKTIRASMGALFRQRISVCSDMPSSVRALQKAGYRVYAAVPDKNAVSLAGLEISDKTCFLVGNEGHGLDAELIASCGGRVYIPMKKGSESLNAASAAGILLWECFKARNFGD